MKPTLSMGPFHIGDKRTETGTGAQMFFQPTITIADREIIDCGLNMAVVF